MECSLSSGQGEAPPGWLSSGASGARLLGVTERVVATRGQADMRGLVTAGRGVRLERSACLGASVSAGVDAHSAVAGVGSVRCLVTVGGREFGGVGYSSRTARDQHQLASSRAMAVLAMVAFFCRASKLAQRWWSRR